MSDLPSRWMARAEALRVAFDHSFSERPNQDESSEEDFLAVRLGSEAYALRLSEIAGLVANKKITRVPSAVGALLGIAGFRGAIVPVYDLQALLGYPAGAAPRWLMIASADSVAFAFDAFDHHLRVSRDAILPRETDGGTRNFIREVVSEEHLTRAIVHLPSIIEAIKKLALQATPVRNDNV